MEEPLEYSYKLPQKLKDLEMTASTTSSLASPGDSGVQLLDSESDIASVMSISALPPDPDPPHKPPTPKTAPNHLCNLSKSVPIPSYFDKFESSLEKAEKNTLNKSLSDEVFEMEHPIRGPDPDLMNISLNSYELLDYTAQNNQMHVSMSEEVNESLKVALDGAPLPPALAPVIEKAVDDQIVFRRQRKKKSKSDTPKKRVSFHEDILNSTKIDDIHINHGFITHELDVGFWAKKPGVVKGRYSWAAEGDAPFYEKHPQNGRETKSDLYITNRFSSTSSSDSSASIDEEDSDEIAPKSAPSLKQPKSSCLKKTSLKKKIDTNIVEEKIKRRSDSNLPLLDTNIFGSLKNILNFSTSVPMAERGVPEGQEDYALYSTSAESGANRPRSCNLKLKAVEPIAPKKPELVPNTKNTLKLTTSEGFYPNYNSNQVLPSNIIICDSNVYEHKGISYSYEYDKFQKAFEQESEKKTPKSSTVYQLILKEFNFFRNRAKNLKSPEEFEVIPPTSDMEAKNGQMPIKSDDSIEEVEEPAPKSRKNSVGKYASTSKLDWSDNETITSDFSSENQSNRHLNSPKRKNKSNHYSVSPFKIGDRNEPLLRSSSSKSSLINRFLRNVTLKKMIDTKLDNKAKFDRKYLNLWVKAPTFRYRGKDELDFGLEDEILAGKQSAKLKSNQPDQKLVLQLKKEIFRSCFEQLRRVFSVRSAYATNGHSRPLLLFLTDTTLYIAGMRNNAYCNHFVLPYSELNTILVGPNAQIVHFSNFDRDMQCMISTGCARITGDLIGGIEMAMRRDSSRPPLFAVKQLGMRDMRNLRRAICKQSSVDKDEEYFYYSIVNIQDFNPDIAEITPLGPNKEGPLMFKTTDMETRWETAYFILKAGVLYMLSSASQRVPMRVFPLINGSCQGAQRVYCSRPHTFQLIIEGKQLHLAAPDEYVASDWLQCLVHAASGGYNQKEKMLTHSCSLLMTNDHILTVREAFLCTIPSLLPSNNGHEPIKGPQVLSCAAIVDLVAFRLPSAEQSWCILEFSCREVHECSGDWILYFATNIELENFISTLELLWSYNNENGDSFPLSTIAESDPLSKKCVDVYTSLKNMWPSNVVHLQFL